MRKKKITSITEIDRVRRARRRAFRKEMREYVVTEEDKNNTALRLSRLYSDQVSEQERQENLRKWEETVNMWNYGTKQKP